MRRLAALPRRRVSAYWRRNRRRRSGWPLAPPFAHLPPLLSDPAGHIGAERFPLVGAHRVDLARRHSPEMAEGREPGEVSVGVGSEGGVTNATAVSPASCQLAR